MDYYYTIFQALLENSSEAVCIFKIINGNIIIEHYNNVYLEQYFSNVSDQIGKAIDEIFSENFVTYLKNKITECLNFKTTLNEITYNAIQKTYCNVRLMPIIIDNNTYIIGSYKNITDIISSVTKNIDLLSDYKALFDNSIYPMCLLEFDRDNNATFIKENEALERFKSEYNIYDLTVKQKELLQAVIEQKKQINTQIRISSDGGNHELYNFSIIPVIKDDRVDKAFVLCVNITTRVRLSEKLYTNITNREREILQLVLDGNPNKCIAYKLKITEGTVKKVLFNCYKKLGITSRAELLKLYMHDSTTYYDK